MERLTKLSRAASLVAVIGLMTWLPSRAQDNDVYESLSDISVGRVFLSPYERARLDERQGSVVVARSSDTPKSATTPKKPRNSGGYIINSSGQSRVWSKYGFVATEIDPKVRFPGDVRIIRKEAPVQQPAAPGAEENADAAEEGARDSGAGGDEA